MTFLDVIFHPVDAFARLLRIDDYPYQPEIVEWPITEAERVDMNTWEAYTATEADARNAP